MGKFSIKQLPEKKRIQMIGEFYDVVVSLRGRSEVRSFFRDLLTPDEIAMLMRRIEVAALLRSGFTYTQIGELLRVGKDKVSSVQRSTQRHGEGYDIVIKRLLERRKTRASKKMKRAKSRNSDFATLKKRYPLGFLLFNLVDELGEALENKKDAKNKESDAVLDSPSIKE